MATPQQIRKAFTKIAYTRQAIEKTLGVLRKTKAFQDAIYKNLPAHIRESVDRMVQANVPLEAALRSLHPNIIHPFEMRTVKKLMRQGRRGAQAEMGALREKYKKRGILTRLFGRLFGAPAERTPKEVEELMRAAAQKKNIQQQQIRGIYEQAGIRKAKEPAAETQQTIQAIRTEAAARQSATPQDVRIREIQALRRDFPAYGHLPEFQAKKQQFAQRASYGGPAATIGTPTMLPIQYPWLTRAKAWIKEHPWQTAGLGAAGLGGAFGLYQAIKPPPPPPWYSPRRYFGDYY